METEPANTLERNTRTIAGVTLVSRVFGLARDLVLVRVFGDTAVGSAFNAAFTIPNLFRRLFGEGALSGAFIPRYAQLSSERTHDGASDADRYASIMLLGLVLVTGVLLVLGETGLLVWLRSTDPGSDDRYAVRLMMLMLPLMPMVCSTAILGGILQVRGRFGVPAAMPLILNSAIIGAGLAMLLTEAAPRRAGEIIAIASLGAGLVQVALAGIALRGRLRPTSRFSSALGEARQTLLAFVPVVIGMGTLQLNTLADTVLAMWPTWVGPTMFGRPVPMDEASNAILGFTQRLYQFPLGVFGLAVATAAFPQLARAAGDPARFGSTIARGVRLSLFVGLPASAGLWLVRDDLVRVLFSGQGGFSDEGVRRAAAVLAGYAIAVWAYSVNHLLVRAFYAKKDTATPTRVSLAMVAINVGLNLLLIWRFREAGLAWSTAATAIVQTALLSLLVRRHATGAALPVGGILRTAAAVLAMAGAVAAVRTLLPAEDWAASLIRLAGMVIVGGAAYLLAAAIFRCPELRWLLARRTPEDSTDATNDRERGAGA